MSEHESADDGRAEDGSVEGSAEDDDERDESESVEEEEGGGEAETEVMKLLLDASNMDLRCEGTLMRR